MVMLCLHACEELAVAHYKYIYKAQKRSGGREKKITHTLRVAQ